MKHTSLLLTAALLAGCSTSPVTVLQSRAIRPDRLLSGYSALAQPSPAKARVVVIRDAGALGSAGPASLIVDGAPVARMWTGERVEFYLASGNHILAVGAWSTYSGRGVAENSFSFAPGRTSYFRISDTTGVFFIQPSAQIQ
jgi:hypothetical protein